ncbi:NepR family anti-sigma factor [Methylobacterium sp. P1-11]|uniref:NepR family anti-sigma factor n=1 Tax=Methylobacterium sp. P1-11 TaxID=2024616 RepID=UPI001FED413B|nr:NepR family anti-sigma factor [Methylobacterium sp. P1-11]
MRDSQAETASDPTSEPRDGSIDEVHSDSLTPSDRPRLRSGLSDQTRNRIAVQLRAMYDTVTQQPVPDRFADLIAQLDSADRKA